MLIQILYQSVFLLHASGSNFGPIFGVLWPRPVSGLFSQRIKLWNIAVKSGTLPNELDGNSTKSLCFRRCHSESYRAIRVILVCTSMLLFVLKSAALATGTFFRRQAQALKSASWELYREFICYTPTKAALQIKLEKEKASSQCVVCMDRRRDVMILSCRHLLMCKQCALTVAVSSGECPVCRTPIDNIISVYT